MWANMFNREAKAQSKEVLDNLPIHCGDAIADIGAGGGFYTVQLAKLTGPSGRIYAVETNRSRLSPIKKLVEENQLHNVKIILAKPEGSPLPADSCHLIFMRNVFHHIEHPVSYFAHLLAALRPDGRLAIIDWDADKKRGHTGFFGHATPQNSIWDTMEQARYARVQTFDFLVGQSFNIFQRRDEP